METIKAWYMGTYTTDSEGKEINDEFTFDDLKEFLNYEYKFFDIYEFIGVPDSIIRERIMAEAAKRFNMTYEEVYDHSWRNPDELKNSKMYYYLGSIIPRN